MTLHRVIVKLNSQDFQFQIIQKIQKDPLDALKVYFSPNIGDLQEFTSAQLSLRFQEMEHDSKVRWLRAFLQQLIQGYPLFSQVQEKFMNLPALSYGQNYIVSISFDWSKDRDNKNQLCLVVNYRKHIFIGFMFSLLDQCFEIFDYAAFTLYKAVYNLEVNMPGFTVQGYSTVAVPKFLKQLV